MPSTQELDETSVEELDAQSVAPSVEEIDTQSVAPNVEEIDAQSVVCSVEEIDAQSMEELNVCMQFKCHGVLDNKQKHIKKGMKQKQIKQEADVKVNLSINFFIMLHNQHI